MSTICIIGAGYTGLTAALRLAQKGHQVTVYEAAPTLGGLAGEVTIAETKIERFYHHIFKSDTAILNLMQELGMEKEIIKAKSKVGVIIENELLPFNGALDVLRFHKMSFIARIRLGLVTFYLTKVGCKKEWETLPAAEWMEKACGKEAFTTIWKPLLVGKFDHYWNKISMNWLWARIHVRANSRAHPLEDEYLYYVRSGFGQLVEKLVQKLTELDVTLHTSTPVQSISQTHHNRVSIQSKLGIKIYDKCVVTTSNTLFLEMTRNLLPNKDPYTQKLQDIRYVSAICMIFSSSQSLSNYYWHNINNLDSPYMVMIEHTNFIPKDQYGGKHVYYLAKYTDNPKILQMNNHELQKQWFAYLKKLFPQFQQNLVDQVIISKAPYAQHIADSTYTHNIPEHQTPLANVYLYNFSQIYPYDRGTNYAVQEGEKAAKEIL